MSTCTHTVTVHGIQEPCGREAVAVRLDPTERTPYPVCPGHVRPPMQPLTAHDRETAASAWDEGYQQGRSDQADHSMYHQTHTANPHREGGADRE